MMDAYTRRTRVAAAALTTAPALALGVVLVPTLPGAQKLWSLLALGVTSYAANVARRLGNRVQPLLWEEWGGAPTTRRLRFSDSPSVNETLRRHADVESALPGTQLPTQDEELADPVAADYEYRAAMGRAINVVRGDPEFTLLAEENRNYGFARNLRGLKPLGLGCAILILGLSLLSGGWVAYDQHSIAATTAFAFPVLVSIVALIGWTQVDSDFVRRPAEAYADRVFDALDKLSRRS